MTSNVVSAIVFIVIGATCTLSDDTISPLVFGRFHVDSPMNDGFRQFLTAIGYNEDDIQIMDGGITLDFKTLGGNKYEYIRTFEGFVLAKKFENGKEFEDTLFGGRKFKGKITIAGNKITRKEDHEGFSCEHVAEFTKEGCTVNFSVTKNGKVVTAKVFFKRVK